MAFATWMGSVTGGCALLVVALTGCGASDEASGSPGTSASTAPAAAEPAGTDESDAPGASPVATPPPAAPSAAPTEVVSLVAVDASGRPVDDFTLPSADPVGQLDCRDGMPSRSADTPGIYHCGASADAADVCWATPTGTDLLCANDPWARELRRYTVDPPLEPIGQTAEPEPWALELADGRTCRIRVGGAWGGRSDGLVGAYSCAEGPEVVLKAPDARTAIDKSTDTWRVAMGELGAGNPDFPPPTTVEVRKAYFAAAPE